MANGSNGLRTVTAILSVCIGMSMTQMVDASPLATPQDKPVLTISGNISEKNTPDAAQFDRTMLENIGMVTIETTSPWYKGSMKFEGVPLDKLMAEVGANGQTLVAYALDDYTTQIPMSDFAKYHAILALKRNGEYMPVRDKGPLFIVYPYDSDPDLKSSVYYSRSAWQVARLVVK
jgi:hypothetical protein